MKRLHHVLSHMAPNTFVIAPSVLRLFTDKGDALLLLVDSRTRDQRRSKPQLRHRGQGKPAPQKVFTAERC